MNDYRTFLLELIKTHFVFCGFFIFIDCNIITKNIFHLASTEIRTQDLLFTRQAL